MKAKSLQGKVRIIGGKWRSRRLTVPEQGVRPTPDGVKETLFNWLASALPGATCLDLFAGTGALGFEALSRGASHVDMIDSSREVVALLHEEAKILQADAASFYHLRLPDGLRQLPPKRYDIVFIDAPFHQKLLLPCCRWLDDNQRLAEGALVYVEMEKEIAPLVLPPHWTLWREKKAGQVAYCLYRIETL